MTFKIYKPHFLGNTNSASLNKSQITISPDLVDYITDTKFVELAYDDENEVIRIKPVEHGIKIYNGKMGAIGFFRNFRIKTGGQFNARYDSDDKCIYIMLK